MPDAAARQFDQRPLTIGGQHRFDTGREVETNVETQMRGPAAETAAGDRQQRVLAAQVLPVGGQIEAPPMLDHEPADITVMARIHPRPGFILLPLDDSFGNAFAKHPILPDRGGLDSTDEHSEWTNV